MNIVILSHIFFPATDGGSKILHILSKYLKSDNRIMVVTSNCTCTDDFVNPQSKTTLKSTENIIRLPVYKNFRRPLKLINLFIKSQTLEIFQKGPFFKILPTLKTYLHLKQFRPDLIICGPFPTTIPLYAKILKKLLSCRLLIAPCFHYNDRLFQNNSLINSLHQSDYIWALTDFEKRFLSNTHKVNLHKIYSIGAGVESSLLINPTKINFPKAQNILYVGSFSAHKNITILLDAFSEISKKHQITLTLAGQKTLYYPKIAQKINRLQPHIKKNIKIINSFPDNKLINLIDSASVLVLPSREESFGLVLLEAWARGKPVVVNNTPALKELVTKSKGGLIFNYNSSRHLSSILSKLLENYKLQQSLGLNGFHYVKKYHTWDKINKSLWSKIS